MSFSGDEFYILASDGKTPAAKMLVLAGQGDLIDPAKMEESVDPSLEIVPFDLDVDPRLLRILFKGREPSDAIRWIVPPVSTRRSPQPAACTHSLCTLRLQLIHAC